MTYELYIEKHDLEVTLDCNVISCNDGIGSYEYWGSKEYDSGYSYPDIDEMTWDKTQFTDEQNEIIENEINSNWDKITTDALKNFDTNPY